MSRSAYVRSFRVALSWQSPVVCTVLLSAIGCSGNPEPADKSKGERIVISSQGTALTAVQNTEIALNGVVDSGSFLADSTSLAETLNAIGGDSTGCDTTSVVCSSTDPDCVPETTEVCTTDEITPQELQEAREDLRKEVDDLVKFLREEVFIEANLVADATTETQVTYRLGADVLCPEEPSDQDPADPAVEPAVPAEPMQDPECVANAEKANLRVRLTQPRENDVDMTIIAGDDFEPVVLQLYHDRLGVKVDLAESLKTLEAMGEEVDEVTSLSGVLQVQLVKNAPVDYSLQFSILEDVALTLDEEGEHYAYSVAKSTPAVELRADGNTKTVSASYNYGAIQILGPFSKFVTSYLKDESPTTGSEENGTDAAPPEPEPEYTGMVELLLAGYTGKVSYTAESDTFVFSDVSFGGSTSTLKHNENLLAALDLNPNNGRKFDATIRAQTLDDGSTSALVSLDPTIDVNLALSFNHIADQVADLSPTLLNDTLRVWFEGANPTFAVESERMRMVSGSFHMSSSQSPESNIDVAEGMCLVENDASVVAETELETTTEGLFEVSVAACE